jgi:hypothetical protein
MGGTTRKILVLYRNAASASPTVSVSTPTAQATTAAPTTQTITAGTAPFIFFACHTSTTSAPAKTWTAGIPTDFSVGFLYVRTLVYDAGVNAPTPANTSVGMGDGGTNIMQSFRISLTY